MREGKKQIEFLKETVRKQRETKLVLIGVFKVIFHRVEAKNRQEKNGVEKKEQCRKIT